MSYFIILRGPLGVGKSTIGKELARKLDGKYISIDKILEKLKLDKVEGDCIPEKNFIKAQESVLRVVKKTLEANKIVVFDGNFYHKGQIKHLTQQLNHKICIFTLQASLKTCIKRDSKRNKAYGKGAATAVHTLVSRLKVGRNINTEGKTVRQTIKEIITILESA